VFILTPALSPDAARWDGVFADGDLAADWGTIHVAADHPLPPVHRVQRLAATANGHPVEILQWPAPGHCGMAY